jgi:hypothetical protein
LPAPPHEENLAAARRLAQLEHRDHVGDIKSPQPARNWLRRLVVKIAAPQDTTRKTVALAPSRPLRRFARKGTDIFLARPTSNPSLLKRGIGVNSVRIVASSLGYYYAIALARMAKMNVRIRGPFSLAIFLLALFETLHWSIAAGDINSPDFFEREVDNLRHTQASFLSSGDTIVRIATKLAERETGRKYSDHGSNAFIHRKWGDLDRDLGKRQHEISSRSLKVAFLHIHSNVFILLPLMHTTCFAHTINFCT